MPQPTVEIVPYLATPLPPLRESYPPGTGGTGPRSEFKGALKTVDVIKGLEGDVEKCESEYMTDSGAGVDAGCGGYVMYMREAGCPARSVRKARRLSDSGLSRTRSSS